MTEDRFDQLTQRLATVSMARRGAIGVIGGLFAGRWRLLRIPALVAGFPTVDGTVIPTMWPGDRFDVSWTFTLDPDGGNYVFGQVPQQLLGGDTDTVI